MKKSIVLDIIMFPGLALHELSHAIAVFLTPGATISNFQLSLSEGEVEYKYKPTAVRAFIISFAPLVVNSVVGWYTAYRSFELYFQSVYTPVKVLEISLLILLSISVFSQSLPSYKDSVSTIQILKRNLISIRFPIVITIGLFLFTLCVPAVIFSFILEFNKEVYYLVSLLYAACAVFTVYSFFEGSLSLQMLAETTRALLEPLIVELKNSVVSKV